MVRKRDEAAPAPASHVPQLPRGGRRPTCSARPARRSMSAAMTIALAGSRYRWGDYALGEQIDHVDGMTVEEAEHQLATRLYQNTAKVHFNQLTEGQGPLRPPADLWRPRHLARPRAVVQRPRQRFPHRRHQWRPPRRAAVRRRDGVRLVGSARRTPNARPRRRRRAAAAHRRHQGPPRTTIPFKHGDDYDPAVMLDLDYWVLMPR